MRVLRPVVKTVGSLSETVRDVGRFREVATILTKHGFGILVSGVIPGTHFSKNLNSTPERAVSAIQELGATFIKFGQILSTRPDIVPLDYLDALQNLQDNVSPLSWNEIKTVLIDNFGENFREKFVSIDEKPVATASIAQVHSAIVKEGDKEAEVVLKIQRPNIQKQILADLNILKFLLERALHEFPEMELFDPRGMFREFQRSLLSELDFHMEIKNLQRFQKNFAQIEGVKLPEPYPNLSSNTLLCMEKLNGISIRKARKNGSNMIVVGERYLKVAYSMLFEHGFFHGDLHPGNVLILENDVIGILDCGMVGNLSKEMKDQLATLIYALYRGDNRLIAKIFFDISIKEKRIDYVAFERDAVEVAERHWSGGSFENMDIGAFLMDLTTRALRHQVHAPTAFTMFFKAVLTTEGLAKSLLPEVDPLQAAQPYVEKLIKERWQPKNWSELGIQNIDSFSGLARRVPISLGQLMDDLDHQRLYFKVEKIERDIDQKRAMGRQGIQALSLFALGWMGMAIAGLFYDSAHIFGFPIFSFFAIIISILLQLFVLGWVWFRK